MISILFDYVALPHIRVEKQFFEIVCKGYQKKCTDFKKVYNPCVKKCPTLTRGAANFLRG